MKNYKFQKPGELCLLQPVKNRYASVHVGSLSEVSKDTPNYTSL